MVVLVVGSLDLSVVLEVAFLHLAAPSLVVQQALELALVLKEVVVLDVLDGDLVLLHVKEDAIVARGVYEALLEGSEGLQLLILDLLELLPL